MTDQPSPLDKDCPKCGKNKWAAVIPKSGGVPTDLRCMECKFEVDYRIVVREPWIVRSNALDGQPNNEEGR